MNAYMIGAALVFFVAAATSATAAETGVSCTPFTTAVLAPPEPRTDPHSRQRLAEINAAVKSPRDRILFLGDSLTERWDPDIWREHFAARDAVNAGVNGDRTAFRRLTAALGDDAKDGERRRALIREPAGPPGLGDWRRNCSNWRKRPPSRRRH